jgi:hypothetical protein
MMSHDYCKCQLRGTRAALKKKHGHIRLNTVRIDIGSDPDFDVMLIEKNNGIVISVKSIWYGTECCSYMAKNMALVNYFESFDDD